MRFSGARWTARIGVVVGLLLAIATLGLTAPAAFAARPLTTALTDSVWYIGGPTWIQKTVATRAHVALIEVDWVSIEPTKPPREIDPTDPNGPEYRFGYLDQLVRQFQGTGISLAFLVSDAPQWAEAPGGSPLLNANGAWEPNATAYGQVATALARRYSGSFPDPLNPGRMLPRVRYFQAWAEANFTIHLAPQWTQSGGRWVPNGPRLYRRLLNSFYAGIKSVRSDDVVITTGFGPYGDAAPGACANGEEGNGCRMHPAQFARELLCLHGSVLTVESCPNPAHFDVLAVDPYQVASPTTPAFNADDVSSPDIWKLTRILTKARRVRTALPRAGKPIWVTEFSYDSNPPNPGGVSLATQARWLEEVFYLFWKQGVSTVVWYLVRDQAPTYNQATENDYFSGLYYYNGGAKPALEAFRFPFIVWPNGRSATVWGISPRTGSLSVQRQSGRSWKTLFRLNLSAGSVFVRSISNSLHGHFRAVVNGEKSLVWTC